jgi:alkylation response protein AidB-like acyl-CoA dehydrogenase
MSLAERSMGLGLRALGRIAGSDAVDRLRVRKPAERVLYRATRDGFRAVGAAGRSFTVVSRRGAKPARLSSASGNGRFDLTATEEQQMLQEALRAFATAQLRPAALDADTACAAAPELLAQAAELGLTMLGVPEALGGAVSERSSVTAVLAAEALAHGDMGLALAALAPAGVATALSLWGDAEQQATYLPALVGEDVPAAAALALQEPRALFDPFALETSARRTDDGKGFVLDGVKALVPRAADAELLIVAARLEGHGPALFLVEATTDGVFSKAAPAMAVRAAATGEVLLRGVRLPARALLGDGDPAVYAACVRRARLAWCALALGSARAVLDYVIPYVNERVAFGEPISHRQGVAFAVSDVAIELEGMRLATLRAASRLDAGKDAAREVALARMLCAEKGAQIGSQGVGLLGGHGFVKEHPVERWYRDLRAVGAVEGALLV